MGKVKHDWLSIQAEYMYASPAISQADLSHRHGINPVTMCRKAKIDKWDEGRNEYVCKVQALSQERAAQGVAGHVVSIYVECQTTLEAVLAEIRTRLTAGTYSNYDLVKTARALALQLESINEQETRVPHSWATVRWTVLKRDKFRCHYCGRSAAEDGVKLHVDHVIPRVLGGTDDPDNLVAACETCNEAKSDELLERDCRG